MDELLQSAFNKKQQLYFSNFLKQYGISGLEQALQLYIDMQQEYICKTKISISKIRISDIYYLKIQRHNISIYTKHDEYYKYGTLNNELKQLSAYNFVKCNQSCLVSVGKIKTIKHNEITLINNSKLHMSRNCAPKILAAFSSHNNLP